MQEILSISTKLAVIVISYLLGCICFAYYLSSIVHKKDIRGIGSGNPGSSNIGRQFGFLWFIYFCAYESKARLFKKILYFFKWADILVWPSNSFNWF